MEAEEPGAEAEALQPAFLDVFQHSGRTTGDRCSSGPSSERAPGIPLTRSPYTKPTAHTAVTYSGYGSVHMVVEAEDVPTRVPRRHLGTNTESATGLEQTVDKRDSPYLNPITAVGQLCESQDNHPSTHASSPTGTQRFSEWLGTALPHGPYRCHGHSEHSNPEGALEESQCALLRQDSLVSVPRSREPPATTQERVEFLMSTQHQYMPQHPMPSVALTEKSRCGGALGKGLE